eukprot:scaffold9773_cov131-Skeletonema_dohrnii-CCMP3373.AAC.1
MPRKKGSIGRRKKHQNEIHSKKNYEKKKAAAAAAAAAATPDAQDDDVSRDNANMERRARNIVSPADSMTTTNNNNHTPATNNNGDGGRWVDRPSHTCGEVRQLIHLHFKLVLNYPPPEEWHGTDGAVSQIVKSLQSNNFFPNRRTIKFVISNSWAAHIAGDDYDPKQRKGRAPVGVKIKDGSNEQKVLADYIEEGMGTRGAHRELTNWFIAKGRQPPGLSSVRSAVKRMTKIMYRAGKRPQGSTDPKSPWAIACHRFTAQILLRAGKIKEEDLPDEFKEEVDGQQVLPECFQKDKLTPIDFEKVGWWDEVHRKAHLGMVNMNGMVTQFPRNEKGEYDPDGTYKKEVFEMGVKFSKEMRKSFGVAKVDGKGVRMNPFDYTEKTILTITNYDKKVKEEIHTVKSFSRSTAKRYGWIVSDRDESKWYRDDPVAVIKGVGKVKKEHLSRAGITTLADLYQYDNVDELPAVEHISPAELKSWYNLGREKYVDEDSPPEKNHLKEVNPFISRYGTEEDPDDKWGEPLWRNKVKERISGFVCITDLVKWIVMETKKLYPGDDGWMFYHDALSQLTQAACIEWMRKTIVPGETKSVLSHWIHSEKGLNDNVGNGTWKIRPPGNRAEFMPLDNSLNQDLHINVNRHSILSRIVVAKNLAPNDHSSLFNLRTPKQLCSAYTRLFHPETGVTPRPDRIVNDIDKAVRAMKVVFEEKGVYVPGLAGGRIPGHRNFRFGKKAKRGGKRTYEDHSGEKGWRDGSVHSDLINLLEDGVVSSEAGETRWEEVATDCDNQMDEIDNDELEDLEASDEE